MHITQERIPLREASLPNRPNMLLSHVFICPMLVHARQHLFNCVLPDEGNVLIIHLEIEILQSNLIFPRSEHSAAHFPGVPCLCIIVQESPSLQYVDLIEP